MLYFVNFFPFIQTIVYCGYNYDYNKFVYTLIQSLLLSRPFPIPMPKVCLCKRSVHIHVYLPLESIMNSINGSCDHALRSSDISCALLCVI